MQLVLHVPYPIPYPKHPEEPLFRTFEWSVIPRKDERISLAEPQVTLEVTNVTHYLDLDMVLAECRVSREGYEALRLSDWSREVPLSIWGRLKANTVAARRRPRQTA